MCLQGARPLEVRIFKDGQDRARRKLGIKEQGIVISVSFGALPLQLFRPRGRWLNTLRGGIPNSDRHDLQRLLSNPSRGVFCLCSRTRMGMQTQSFRDLSRRQKLLPRYSDVGRRGRGRLPQFQNFASSRAVLLNGV